MSRAPLLVSEKCLIVLLIVVLSIAIPMSVLVGLVLPPDLIRSPTSKDKISTPQTKTSAEVSTREITQASSENNSSIQAEKFMNLARRYHFGVQVFSYLVSLTIPTYFDEENEGRRYACSGTILSRTWILVGKVFELYNEIFVASTLGTGEECVSTGEEWMKLKIRAGSDYWSKGGTEHSPVSISRPKVTQYSDTVVGLKVNPYFTFGTKVAKVRLPERCRYFYWKLANSAEWETPKTKQMFDTFKIGKWALLSRTMNGCRVEEVTSERRCKTLASNYNIL